MVVGFHRRSIIAVVQRCKRDVAVDLVALGRGGVGSDVAVKSLRVLVQVKCKLCIVEHSVLGDALVETEFGCSLERFHCSDVVVGLEVAVCKMVLGYLAEIVVKIAHAVEIAYGALIVLHGVENGTCVEIVRPCHIAV